MSENNELLEIQESTELSVKDVLGGLVSTPSKFASKESLAVVTRSGGFLPYIQLMAANNAEVLAQKAKPGSFRWVKGTDKVELGTSFLAMILSWRPKAMQYKPSVLSFFNPNSPQFKEVQARSQTPNSNCGFGPEFLLWLPEQKVFGTFFQGNVSGRIEAPAFIVCFESGNKKCRISSSLVQDKLQRSWFVAKYSACDLDFVLPTDVSELKTLIEGFNNPPDAQEAVAEKAEGDERR